MTLEEIEEKLKENQKLKLELKNQLEELERNYTPESYPDYDEGVLLYAVNEGFREMEEEKLLSLKSQFKQQ
jgi:HEPN domain-containing protein